MSEKTLADVFAEEPADGTHLVVWTEHALHTEPRVIWRDDEEAKSWGGQPDERWFHDSHSDPMGLDVYLRDATMVHAVVPLGQSGLKLTPAE